MIKLKKIDLTFQKEGHVHMLNGCEVSGAFNGLKENEIRAWLTSLKTAEYSENLKALGLDPEIEI